MNRLKGLFSSNSSENASVFKTYDKDDKKPKLSDQVNLETYGQIKLDMGDDKKVLSKERPLQYPESITNGLASPTEFNGVEREIVEKLQNVFISEEKMRFILSVIESGDIPMKLKCAYALDFQKLMSVYYSELPPIIDLMDKHQCLKETKYHDIITFLESQIDTHLLTFSDISNNLDFLCMQSGILNKQNIIERLTLDKSGKSMLHYTIFENIISDLSTLHLKLSEDIKIILSDSSDNKYDICQKSLQHIADYELSLHDDIYQDNVNNIRQSAGNFQTASLMDDMSMRVLDAFNALEESMKLIKNRCDNIAKPMEVENEPEVEPEDLEAMFEKVDIVPNDIFRNGRIVRGRGVSSTREDFVPCTSEEECMRRLVDENKKLDNEQNEFYEKSIKNSLQNYLTTANYYINLEKKIDALKTEIRSHIRGLVSSEVVLGKRRSPPKREKPKNPTTTYDDNEELEQILLQIDTDLENAILKTKQKSNQSTMNIDIDNEKEIELKIQEANDRLFNMRLDRVVNGIKDINKTRKYDIVNEKGKGYIYLYKMLVKMATYRNQYNKSDDKEVSMEKGIINMLDIKGEYKPDNGGGDDDNGADDVSPPVTSSRKTARLTRSG